ncbi:MAG: hypothetical protein ACK52I_25660 [Pseudomonadota bacterium]
MRARRPRRGSRATARRGTATSCRGGNLRVSPHAYNDEADVEALFRALRSRRSLLRAA